MIPKLKIHTLFLCYTLFFCASTHALDIIESLARYQREGREDVVLYVIYLLSEPVLLQEDGGITSKKITKPYAQLMMGLITHAPEDLLEDLAALGAQYEALDLAQQAGALDPIKLQAYIIELNIAYERVRAQIPALAPIMEKLGKNLEKMFQESSPEVCFRSHTHDHTCKQFDGRAQHSNAQLITNATQNTTSPILELTCELDESLTRAVPKVPASQQLQTTQTSKKSENKRLLTLIPGTIPQVVFTHHTKEQSALCNKSKTEILGIKIEHKVSPEDAHTLSLRFIPSDTVAKEGLGLLTSIWNTGTNFVANNTQQLGIFAAIMGSVAYILHEIKSILTAPEELDRKRKKMRFERALNEFKDEFKLRVTEFNDLAELQKAQFKKQQKELRALESAQQKRTLLLNKCQTDLVGIVDTVQTIQLATQDLAPKLQFLKESPELEQYSETAQKVLDANNAGSAHNSTTKK